MWRLTCRQRQQHQQPSERAWLYPCNQGWWFDWHRNTQNLQIIYPNLIQEAEYVTSKETVLSVYGLVKLIWGGKTMWISHHAVGVYQGTMLLFRVKGWKSSSMLSILSMFLEPIVPLQILKHTQGHTYTHICCKTSLRKHWGFMNSHQYVRHSLTLSTHV